MAGFEKQGRLLKRWRTAAGMSQCKVAGALGIAETTLSEWESGRNGLSFASVIALDTCYGADGALFEMAQGLGTLFGLPARREWTRYPPPDHGTGWAWLRPLAGAGRIEATLQRGDLECAIAQDCDDEGVILQLPASSPVTVVLSRPGWVHFGPGRVPAGIGIPSIRIVASSPRIRANGAGRLVVDHPYPADRIPSFTGADYRTLRDSRCFTRDHVARLATELHPDLPVDEEAIRRLEHGANPRCKLLRSRLDLIYSAGGHTCSEQTFPIDYLSPIPVAFPTYWTGPVWFTFTSDRVAPADVRIRRGTAERELVVTSGATVTSEVWETNTAPFVVEFPEGWSFTTGMGARPGAASLRWPVASHPG